MLLRTLSPITPGKGVICCNMQWDISLGWVDHFAQLDVGELLSLHWDLV